MQGLEIQGLSQHSKRSQCTTGMCQARDNFTIILSKIITIINIFPIIRALLKIAALTLQYFVLGFFCIMIRIRSWSPCQNQALKFSDTKEHDCTLLSCFRFQCVHLKCKSAFKFHSSFWCYGSCISMLVICQYCSNKLERKFWIWLFWLSLSAELSI